MLLQIESGDPNADYTARRNVMIVEVGFRCDRYVRVLQRFGSSWENQRISCLRTNLVEKV